MLQITRNAADNPLHSTDAGSKMLRARCKQGIQGQNALNTFKYQYHANCIIKFQNPANIVQIRDFSCTKLNYSRPKRFTYNAIACLSAQTLHILYK